MLHPFVTLNKLVPVKECRALLVSYHYFLSPFIGLEMDNTFTSLSTCLPPGHCFGLQDPSSQSLIKPRPSLVEVWNPNLWTLQVISLESIGYKPLKVNVAQSCPTLCNPMDCSLPGFSVHGIFQARILEWVAITFFPTQK